MAQSHQGGEIEQVAVLLHGAAMGDDAILGFIVSAPKTVVAR